MGEIIETKGPSLAFLSLKSTTHQIQIPLKSTITALSSLLINLATTRSNDRRSLMVRLCHLTMDCFRGTSNLTRFRPTNDQHTLVRARRVVDQLASSTEWMSAM
jgi:hypothetical protein